MIRGPGGDCDVDVGFAGGTHDAAVDDGLDVGGPHEVDPVGHRVVVHTRMWEAVRPRDARAIGSGVPVRVDQAHPRGGHAHRPGHRGHAVPRCADAPIGVGWRIEIAGDEERNAESQHPTPRGHRRLERGETERTLQLDDLLHTHAVAELVRTVGITGKVNVRQRDHQVGCDVHVDVATIRIRGLDEWALRDHLVALVDVCPTEQRSEPWSIGGRFLQPDHVRSGQRDRLCHPTEVDRLPTDRNVERQHAKCHETCPYIDVHRPFVAPPSSRLRAPWTRRRSRAKMSRALTRLHSSR